MDDSGILDEKSPTSGPEGFFNEKGSQFIKAGGTGVSKIEPPFTNSGQLTVSSGTLKIPKETQVEKNRLKNATTVMNNGVLDTDGVLELQGGILENVGPSALDGEVYGNVDNSGGEVAPGGVGGIGVLTIDGVSGNYTQSGSGALDITIAGPDAGTQYSQLVVTGTVTLGGKLNIDALPNFQGNYFVLINNEGNQAVHGIFDGLPEGGANPFLRRVQLDKIVGTAVEQLTIGLGESNYEPAVFASPVPLPTAAAVAPTGRRGL